MSLFYEDLERRSKTWASVSLLFSSYVSNRAVKKSAELQRIHYDLGNELYEAMLDEPFMVGRAAKGGARLSWHRVSSGQEVF